ncbi:MAG TPA: plasmid replication initiator TrfA [Arsenophonus nasoniae]|uniref:plasmid replication initiator TrfA n=1 Tax=Arsenophonus nasoniae TaxID=638 RepID=UPI003879FC57
MSDIFKVADRIAKKIAERETKKVEKIEQNHEKKQCEYNKKKEYLPMTKSNFIPVPNSILRSSLFGIVKKGSRKFEKNVLKASFKGYTVKYTGEQLDQSDLDVWLECLQRCQPTPLGYTVRFSAHNFLQSIGRNTGKTDHEWLKSVFQRLRVNDVEISDGKYTYAGSLIFEQYRDEETGVNCLVLNPKIVACFGKDRWTGFTKEIRLKLKGKSLTQWLHAFYSSHSKPLPIKIITLKELCGSTTTKDFKQKIKKSLSELAFATNWSCEIDSTDKVIIKKN